MVGYLDSVVAAKQNADRFGYSISPNRELVALGAANIVGSFVPGTLPAYGSITRSRINADVGGRSQMASIICSAVVLFTTFFLLPWLYFLPRCVLAAVWVMCLLQSNDVNFLISICLIVFNLLSEIPDDLLYFWRSVLKCHLHLLSRYWSPFTGWRLGVIWDLWLSPFSAPSYGMSRSASFAVSSSLYYWSYTSPLSLA